jgi:hypothetical protein
MAFEQKGAVSSHACCKAGVQAGRADCCATMSCDQPSAHITPRATVEMTAAPVQMLSDHLTPAAGQPCAPPARDHEHSPPPRLVLRV